MLNANRPANALLFELIVTFVQPVAVNAPAPLRVALRTSSAVSPLAVTAPSASANTISVTFAKSASSVAVTGAETPAGIVTFPESPIQLPSYVPSANTENASKAITDALMGGGSILNSFITMLLLLCRSVVIFVE